MNKTIIYFILFFCLACVCSVHAGDVRDLAIHARSVGIGHSGVAVTADFAASGNPASLGFQLGSVPVQDSGPNTMNAGAESDARHPFSLSVSQARLAYDQYGYQVLFTVPLKGNLAFRFDQKITQNAQYYRMLFNTDGTPIIDPATNQQAMVLTYDTQVDSLFGLGYGLKILNGISLGLEAQAVHLKIGEDYAWGFDGDMGMIFELPGIQDVSAGVVLRHCNAQWQAWRVPYREERAFREIQAGVRYQLPDWDAAITGALHQQLNQEELLKGKIGIEYNAYDPLTIRIGWDADHLNLGAGFKWQQVNVEYAAVIGNALYDANRITVKIVW